MPHRIAQGANDKRSSIARDKTSTKDVRDLTGVSRMQSLSRRVRVALSCCSHPFVLNDTSYLSSTLRTTVVLQNSPSVRNLIKLSYLSNFLKVAPPLCFIFLPAKHLHPVLGNQCQGGHRENVRQTMDHYQISNPRKRQNLSKYHLNQVNRNSDNRMHCPASST